MVLYLATLLVCGGLAGVLVYRYDLHEREPWHALLLTAAAGVVLMRGAAAAERAVLGRLEGDLAAAATAALVEELLRLAFVVLVALVARRTFNDPMDGVVYGSILGLGMGLEESVALVAHVARLAPETLAVEVVRLLGHLVMGGITGFGVGLARLRVPGWGRALAGAVLASIALHFLWDAVALLSPVTAAGAVLQSLAGVAVLLSGILLYGILVAFACERSRRVFAPGSRRSLWGWPFRRAGGPPPPAGSTPRAREEPPRRT